jgi:N,N-dimethylformamidase beta subunit-like protein/tachylectin
VAYDQLQRFIQLVPGGNGIIYAIQADGALLWYRHAGWQTGAVSWANGGQPRTIGSGWNKFTTVLANSDGQIFGFMADGTCHWYKYVVSDLSTGAGSWASPPGGSLIGSGFDGFPRIIGGWNGEFFCIDNAGGMYWFQYTAGNGSGAENAWADNGLPQQVGSGWLTAKRAWAEDSGVLYATRQDNSLVWFRHLGGGSWANGGTQATVGQGWGEVYQKTAFSNGSGTVYALMLASDQVNGTDSNLNWYRLTNYTSITPSSGAAWANSGRGIQVGSGFTFESTARLQGYATAPSVSQGATANVAVSTTFGSYDWSVVQLAPQPSGSPATMLGPTSATGQLQTLPSGYRVNGCGWQNSISVQVPASWPSGLYAALLVSPYGHRYYAPFTVKPSAPSQKLAFLLPTNTYNAYNSWAGHSRYTTQNGSNVTLTFQRPSTTVQADPPAVITAELYNDLFLLSWMSANSIAFDCYTDSDLNASGTWLTSYKAVILGAHPEYWSDAMRASIMSYLQGGGRVIAPGGNTLYERTTFSSSGLALTWSPVGNRDLFINHNEPESQVVGAIYDNPDWNTFGPFQVDDASHKFFAGTGVSNGDQFGQAGYNGKASGWEVNGPLSSTVTGATQLAHGAGQPSDGAVMVYIDSGNGGWVFAANSLSFNGAIAQDPVIPQILSNVFAAAVQ